MASANIFQDNKSEEKENDYQTLGINMPVTGCVNVDIEFKDIRLEVSTGFFSKKSKTILKDVSGHFKSGQLTAIMGPSGAGKTSLINTLTGFSSKNVNGKIRVGETICELGKNVNSLNTLRKRSCYILHDDRLNPLFTVRELMEFATDFKLGDSLTPELKNSVINDILKTLGLSDTENTRCCKLSGGERKRLSIAVELIENPPVLFLDEPTTGLDIVTSKHCMKILKGLARAGRTIILTIHQPTASVYKLFDQVYILAEGMCIYDGPSADTVPYLASLGFQCPKYHNPADYILEIANGEYGKFNDSLASKINNCHHFTSSTPERPLVKPIEGSSRKLFDGKVNVKKPHELYRFGVLFKRNLLQLYRDLTMTHLKVLLHIIVGVLMGLLIPNSGNDASKTFSNLGYLVISAVYLSFTSLMPAVLRFPDELLVLKKENFNNWYNLKTYYIAVLVTSLPLQFIFSIAYSAPSYVISGQPIEMTRFALFVLVLVNVTLIADAIGNLIGTCAVPVNGTFFATVITCTMVVFAGFIVLPSHMHYVMKKLSHISFLKYGFEALALSVYGRNRPALMCPENKLYCHMKFPKEIIKQMDFKQDNYWTDVAILFIAIVVLRIVAFYTLRRQVKKSN